MKYVHIWWKECFRQRDQQVKKPSMFEEQQGNPAWQGQEVDEVREVKGSSLSKVLESIKRTWKFSLTKMRSCWRALDIEV
jgi:hypothetical protein